MIFRTLTALFARYCGFHLTVTIGGRPLTGQTGEVLGHTDRISLRGQRLVIEGWADAGQIVLTHAGQRLVLSPDVPRADVTAAYPSLSSDTPGFLGDLPHGDGGATVTLIHGNTLFVHPVALPDARRIARARRRLVWPFLHDMWLAAPILLHWFATKDPADRSRLKQRLRLVAPTKAQPMQPFLFLQEGHLSTANRNLGCEQGARHPAFDAVTIVMPIYNALDLLPEVLDRVLRHTDMPWRLILIEDASSDPGVRPYLRQWVQDQKFKFPDRITLIENAENQGFIRSVNRGLKLAIGHGDPVILLNSDALVPKDWARRLTRPLLLHDHVASVTPMSNDAEIFSAPVICSRRDMFPGQADEIDAIAATLHPDAALTEAPTGVGFCMALSIDYLRRIPTLDTAFGRGYGEEVDWCQKARALGGRNLGLANLFVEHRGGASFGTVEKQRLVARNNAEIARRYPAYDADVQNFIAADPLAAARLALGIACVATEAAGPLPIYLAHNLGGGADDYLAHRIAQDMPNAALVLRVGTALRWQLELHCQGGVTRGATDDFALIQQLLAPIRQRLIIYSCGVGDPDPVELPRRLLLLKRGAQDCLEALIHDYLPISPSYTLLDSAGRYDGPPDPLSPDTAHRQRRPDGTVISLPDWQAAWGDLFANADTITTFSTSSAQIVAAAYPAHMAKLRVHPHRLLHELPRLPVPARSVLPVIGVLGNIGYQKGAAVLRDLSHMLDQAAVAKLVVLGQIDPQFALADGSVLHGGYLRRDIPALAARYGITDWLIPSIWPETFSYTTHEAIATGLPVWCFDLGAQADAVRSTGIGGAIAIPSGVPKAEALLAAILRSHTDHDQSQPESFAA